jgi:hypothetical protein
MLAACYQWIGFGLLAFTTGCAMCNSCDDYTYGAYGGRWERLDPCYGRVGSAFTPEVGQRVDVDELHTPEMHGVPNETKKPDELTPMEPMPESTESTPADGPPAEAMPSETPPTDATPMQEMPAEDAPPQPPRSNLSPQTRSKDGKPLDASVLRRPSRARR